jgi:hypothetical protein
MRRDAEQDDLKVGETSRCGAMKHLAAVVKLVMVTLTYAAPRNGMISRLGSERRRVGEEEADV